MFYIKIVDGAPQGYPISADNIRYAIPNVSLPAEITAEDIAEYGFIPFQFSLPPELQRFESIEEIQPELIDGVLIQQFTVREMGEQEKQIVIDQEITSARNLQRSLLADSDWTEFASVRAKHTEEWATAWEDYRNLLRDVDKQDSWPFDLNWPMLPVELDS
jgi:hypothetical protein